MAPVAAVSSGTHMDVSKIPNNAHPKWWKDPGMRKLAGAMAMGYCATINGGYDGSLVGGLFALPRFLAMLAEDRDGPLESSIIGLVASSLLLGTFGSFLIGPLIADRYGRRVPILIGGIIVIAGAFMQTFVRGSNKFIGGRVVMGFGSGLMQVAGTTYVTEIAHPRFRAQATSLATTTYFVGAIVAAWFTFGTLNINGDWSFKLPVLMQAVPCSIQIVLMLIFCHDDSPRWLVSRGRYDDAVRVLARFHANGKEDDQLVQHEFAEMKIAIEAEAAATAGTSYLSFFKTPGNRKRLYLLLCIGFSSQWVGNGVISYYLPQILTSIGITTASAQTGVNGGLSIWSWFAAIFGAMMSERLGRRTLWLASACGCLFCYILITVCSALFAEKGASAAGKATIAFIYMFNGFYAIGFTAVGNGLYPLEILPYGLRTKGFAITLFTSLAAAFFNIYVNPIALESIAWKYYFVFIVVLVATIANIYFYYPETSNRTLEEIGQLFDGPSAVTDIVDRELAVHPEALVDDIKKGDADTEQLEYAKQ